MKRISELRKQQARNPEKGETKPNDNTGRSYFTRWREGNL